MIRNPHCKEDINKDNLSFYVWRMTKIWERAKQNVLMEFGLTPPQMEVLGALHKLSGIIPDIRQVDIAQATLTDPMTTSSILRNLERKGYVARTKRAIDTRAFFVTITPGGLELLERAKVKAEEFQNKMFETIDKREVIEVFKKILDRFDELLEEKKLSDINK